MGFDRKEDLKSDFKEDQRSEEVSSIKKSKAEKNSRRYNRATGLHSRAPQAKTPHSRQVEKHGRAQMHGHPCAWHTALRCGKAMPEPLPVRFCNFLVIYMLSLPVFRDFLGFFWQHFRMIIRVQHSLNKPFQGEIRIEKNLV